jgi:hypothetical protein
VTEDRYAVGAARLLREARSRTVPTQTPSADRAIAALADTMWRAGARRRRRRGLLIGAAGTTLAVAAAAAVLVLRGGGSAPAPLAPVAPVSISATPSVVFGRPDGASLADPGELPRALSSGEAPRAGDRLRVADVAEVCGQARVPAGGRWPPDCHSSDLRTASACRIRVRRAVGRPARAVAVGPRPSTAPSSTLATENDLFASVLRAERDRNPGAAIELLDLLLKRFPGSPLHASAAAVRERLH